MNKQKAEDYLKDYVSYPIKITDEHECVMYNESSVLAMIREAYKDGANAMATETENEYEITDWQEQYTLKYISVNKITKLKDKITLL